MNEPEVGDEALIYKEEEPDIDMLAKAYEDTILEIDTYLIDCETAYNDRRNIWPGKSNDLRKGGATAFPWNGASDQEVNVVGERLDTYVSIFSQASERSHIKAKPTSTASMDRAATVSSFLKYMRSDYIPDFSGQMELAANYLLEKGMMISYVGWKRESRTFLQTVTLEEIAQVSPEMAQTILDGSDDEVIVAMLQQASPDITPKRAKKAIAQLRKTGSADIPIPRLSVDCPIVHTCAPDGEVLFPSYVTDPQRSPYVFWRTFLTAQELEKKVTNEGWDRDWVNHMIEKYRGQDSYKLEGERTSRNVRTPIQDDSDLVMVVYCFQRLIDEDDGSEGIYQTVFHPLCTDMFAIHELLNGYDDYPFVVTRLSNDQKRLYESRPMTTALRGPQMQIKTERDSRVDRASMATLPPLMHPAGRPPTDWGPGRKVPYRRLGEIAFGPIPQFDAGSVEIEAAMTRQADRAVGLDMENPLSNVRQQFYVNKYLRHEAKVLALAWKLFQRMGPDQVFFQVSGNPDGQTITKGNGDEDFRITVAFDTQSTDPDTAEKRTEQMVSAAQLDRNGRMDMDKLLEVVLMGIDPSLADYILQPKEVAEEKMLRDVTDDLTKIFAGIEVPARPNGAQTALGIIQSYAQQPDIAARMQQDEAFAERVSKYAQQYQMVIQQAQNAQIGRIGTPPAAMGQTETQGMQQ